MKKAMYRLDSSKVKEVSEYIVNNIIDDIGDRRGIGDEFESIDDDIQDEIRSSWNQIVLNGLSKLGDEIPDDISELSRNQSLELLYSYDDYIKDNIENNEEFGKSWFPVSVEEFFYNDYREGNNND